MPTALTDQTYDATLAQITALGAERMKLGTDRIRAMLNALGNPHDHFRSIHVVGTNGKGSTSRILASAYQAAGFRVGLFTSPHLVDVRERIVMCDARDEAMISKALFTQYGQLVLSLCAQEHIALSYFECLTVIGFLAFAEASVDIAIIEAGLGGRLDSTNVLKSPEAVVITPIAEDHVDLLGPTLEDIAREKAAVIHTACPVILAQPTHKGVESVIHQHAHAHQAPITTVEPSRWQAGELALSGKHAGRRGVTSPQGETIWTPLLGRYQHVNIGVAHTVIQALQEHFPVSPKAFHTGLETVHWPGRAQLLPEHRLLLDGSHNPHGLAALAEMIAIDFAQETLELAISLLSTKDPLGLVPLLNAHPWQRITFLECSKSQGHSYHSPDTLQHILGSRLQALSEKQCEIQHAPLSEWLSDKPSKSLSWRICTGSLYTVGSVLNALGQQHREAS